MKLNERERGERDSVCVYTSLRWVREEREPRTIVYIRDCEESGGESACEVRGGREREKIIGERVERGCVYTKLCSNQSYE